MYRKKSNILGMAALVLPVTLRAAAVAEAAEATDEAAESALERTLLDEEEAAAGAAVVDA